MASDSLAELMNVTKRCMVRLFVSVVILMVFYGREQFYSWLLNM
jgi:hypothetical protein